ncbi:MAG: hypothetical protein ACLFPQ_04610 [Candidatus Woesearchaeota archaeon]
MSFDEKHYAKEFERLLSIKSEAKFFIKKSSETFKIKNSFRKEPIAYS